MMDEQEMERQQALTQLNPEFEEFLDWWDGREDEDARTDNQPEYK